MVTGTSQVVRQKAPAADCVASGSDLVDAGATRQSLNRAELA